MAIGRRRTPDATRSQGCAARRALRPAVVALAALALLLAVAGCAWPEPSPDTRPMTEPTNGGDYGPCERGHGTIDKDEPFLYWAQDGAHLVFNVDYSIWTLELEDVRLQEAAEVSDERPPEGFHADVSPDGSQIVYSTCEYQLADPPPEFAKYAHENVYEIAVVNIDGTERTRLTETVNFESYPAWSPDGTHVAFVIRREEFPYAVQLALIALETGEMRWLEGTGNVGLDPPAWSPDGRRLAYVVYVAGFVVYTIGVDGTELTRTAELPENSESTAPLDWSPDSSEIAFASLEGEETVLYAAKADRSALREVWRSGADSPSAPITQVSWSPDGSELLFVSDRVYVVGADGSDPRLLFPALPDTTFGLGQGDGSRDMERIAAAWSPAGSRVAVYYPKREASSRVTRTFLVSVSADGTDLRPLVQADDEGRIYAWPNPETPADLTSCSAGIVVPDPEENAGLVQDCEGLLGFRQQIAQGMEFGWSEDTAISEWKGVTVGDSPPRVHEVELRGRGLIGRLSLELAKLTELMVLDLSGNDLAGPIPPELGGLEKLMVLDLPRNDLTGIIPPELGGLTKLVRLDLSENDLTGPIPPELGNLTELTGLDLSSNPLGGGIPPELGGLSALRRLKLNGNFLTGPIPPELGRLRRLGSLVLFNNELSGIIPPELGMLVFLDRLDLRHNLLSGPIPPELGQLRSLRQLRLDDNMLSGSIPLELGEVRSLNDLGYDSNLVSGCIPLELPRIWVVTSKLPHCLD